eukprot:gene6775-7538_t
MGESCSCYPYHPQEIFCSTNTDFVIKAVVVSGKHGHERNTSSPLRGMYGLGYTYNTYITKIFKGHDKLKSIFMLKNSHNNNTKKFKPRRQKAIIHTGLTSGTCRVNLKPGTKYLLSGAISDSVILNVGTCDLVKPFKKLSALERAGVRGAYDCRCQLKKCPIDQVCQRTANTCEWNVKHVIALTEMQCDMKYRACKMVDEKCSWKEDQNKYETCVMQHEKEHS